MVNEAALQMANSLRGQVAELVSGVVKAVDDNRLDALEVVAVTMQASQLASVIIGFARRSTREERRDLLFVLQHARLVLDE